MGLTKRLRQIGVTTFDGLEDRPVRINDLHRRVQVFVDLEQRPNGGHVAQERGMKPSVATQPADGFVEIEIRSSDPSHVATLHAGAHLLDDRLQFLERPWIGGHGDETSSGTLDGRSKLVDLPYVTTAQRDHERSPPGFVPDEALGPQELERFADRAATDVELLGESRLDQMLTATEPAGEDLLADHIGRIPREMPWVKGTKLRRQLEPPLNVL